MLAATVIPAPMAYSKVVASETLIVECLLMLAGTLRYVCPFVVDAKVKLFAVIIPSESKQEADCCNQLPVCIRKRIITAINFTFASTPNGQTACQPAFPNVGFGYGPNLSRT